ITRTFSKQGIISVFLIVTLALGLFYANIARTINSNSVERIRYNIGADMVVSETWEKKFLQSMGSIIDYEFVEPDFVKYNRLLEEGLCESITRVVYDDDVEVKRNTKKNKNVMMQGIITNEYGKTASLKDELNGEQHWYYYLNALSQEPQGVIISSNLAEELEVSVGDTVDVIRYGAVEVMKTQERGSMKSPVCAIVDNWPGYEKYVYDKNEMKENYLIVMNYATAFGSFETSPYEVWLKLADGVSSDKVEAVLGEMELFYPEITGVEKQVQEMKESTLIQITNGMFTLSFIIALVLCAVGFMIYWIASIRQRELLFGVYRAMGMTVRDINMMLINEHIFSTLLSVLTGAGVGMIATAIFAELFGVVYLPQIHNIDIFLHFDIGDITKIAIVVILMMVVCLMVLRRLIKSMNITQALKLGED
ncbi:MAG: ABC transporter permease, partial [Lachnospiraceae bacterium]|nr:ABC transporter permease [Lachnospiraceae bacterium]